MMTLQKANRAERDHAYYLLNRDRILAREKARYASKSDEIKAYKRDYYQEHRDKIRARTKAWGRANTDRKAKNAFNSHLRTQYGITHLQYEEMRASQQFRCGACGRHESQMTVGVRLFVDHDHQTGRVRGLLCYQCNVAIGLLGDSMQGVRGAFEYMQRSCRTRNEMGAA